MSLWEKYELTVKRIFAIIIAIVIFGWMMTIEEYEPDDPVLTIIDKCELILRNQMDVPKNVIEQCKKLLKEDLDE
jgi:hypothetical protein